MGCPQGRNGERNLLCKAVSGPLRPILWRRRQLWATVGNTLSSGNGVLPVFTTGVLLPFLACGLHHSDPCPQIYFHTFTWKEKMLGLCHISPDSFTSPVHTPGYKQISRPRCSRHLLSYPLPLSTLQAPNTHATSAQKSRAHNKGWAGKLWTTGSLETKVLICRICWFPWWKCPHRGQFQATLVMSPSTELGCDMQQHTII